MALETERAAFRKNAEERFQGLLDKLFQGLMDKLCTNDSAEVIRNALRLYEWAIEEVEAGKKIGAIDKDGKAVCIDLTP